MTLVNDWSSIKADLAKARNTLPQSSDNHELIVRYQEFLDHNELELACDVLAEFAKNFSAKAEFWIALRDAAIKMKLSDQAKLYEEHIPRLAEKIRC